MGIEHAKLFNMINSWIIYLRLSSCHYVNKMIIGSSYGLAYSSAFILGSSNVFHSEATILFAIDEYARFLIVCYCQYWPYQLLDDWSAVNASRVVPVRTIGVYIFVWDRILLSIPMPWKTNEKPKSCFWSRSGKVFLLRWQIGLLQRYVYIQIDEMCWKNQQRHERMHWTMLIFID